jgi:hypothetical protein
MHYLIHSHHPVVVEQPELKIIEHHLLLGRQSLLTTSTNEAMGFQLATVLTFVEE